MPCAAIDFGGSVTDVVVRDAAGERLASRAAVSGPSTTDIARLLTETGGEGFVPEFVAVTGGRSASLHAPEADLPVEAVDESRAVAAGALRCGVADPAIVVSLGTGTGMVLARPPDEPLRLLGSGIGGGTLIGLSRLLLGTEDVAEIGGLAQRGDASRCDLTVGDIVGGAIGPIGASATAAHFGRLTRADGSSRPEDVAAALVGLIGQNALRLAIDAVVLHGARSIVLLGHVLDVPGFREVIRATPGLDTDFVRMPADAGFAVARGALDVALARRGEVAG